MCCMRFSDEKSPALQGEAGLFAEGPEWAEDQSSLLRPISTSMLWNTLYRLMYRPRVALM